MVCFDPSSKLGYDQFFGDNRLPPIVQALGAKFMTEVRCKDTITKQQSGFRERETNSAEAKEDRDRGGETNASLLLCCGTIP